MRKSDAPASGPSDTSSACACNTPGTAKPTGPPLSRIGVAPRRPVSASRGVPPAIATPRGPARTIAPPRGGQTCNVCASKLRLA